MEDLSKIMRAYFEILDFKTTRGQLVFDCLERVINNPN